MDMKRPGPDPSKDADRERVFLDAARERAPGRVRHRFGVSRGVNLLGYGATGMGSRERIRGAWATGEGIGLLKRAGLPLGAGPTSTTARLRAALKYPLFPP